MNTMLAAPTSVRSLPRKYANKTIGSVFTAAPPTKRVRMYSLQEITNANRNETAKPGSTIGNVIFLITVNRDAPNT